MTAVLAPQLVSHRTLVQLLRRNATVFLTVFTVLWAVRFTLAVGAPEVIGLVALVGGLVGLLASTWASALAAAI